MLLTGRRGKAVWWLNNTTGLEPKRGGGGVMKKRAELAVEVEVRKKDTEVGRELEFPADVGFDARAVGAWPQVEVVSSHWFSPFFASSLHRLSWACFEESWLCLIWRCYLLGVVCVLCCRPAPVPCRETVQVLCCPACSLLPPPADLPAGCHCIAPSDT